MLGALGAAAGAVLGGLAGAQGSKQSTTGSTTSTVRLRNIADLNKGRSALETAGDDASLAQFNQLAGLVTAGPNQTVVSDAMAWDQNFGAQLQSMLNGPTGAQVGQANQFAQDIFAPQQLAMQQGFQDQGVQANRLAARLGRAGNDPILRAKLAQEQTRQSAMLNSQQGSFAAQYAQQMPQQFMQMGSALSNLKNGLATQAFQNRQALLTLGQQLTQGERNYRLNTATRTGDSTSVTSGGGGMAGAIGGAMAGAGGAMDLMGKFGGGGISSNDSGVTAPTNAASGGGGSRFPTRFGL